MNATATLIIPFSDVGLPSNAFILSCTAAIRDDDLTFSVNLLNDGNIIVEYDPVGQITFSRNSLFNTASFDDPIVNRGVVTVNYLVN